MSRQSKEGKSSHIGLVIGILGALIALAGIFIGAVMLDKRQTEQAISRDTYDGSNASTTYERGSITLDDNIYYYYHNYENYLIMGTDETGNPDGEGTEHQNPMADFMMLLSIDKTAKTYTIIELNRDSMTDVDILNWDGTYWDTEEMQLCVAHWYGKDEEQGCENQVKAVSRMLGGLRINGYISMPIGRLEEFNALIGGVTLELLDDFTDLDPAMKKGETLTLTDQQAYYYLRRRMDVGEGTNEGRMARQHQYINAFLEEGMSKLSSSPNYFYDVFEKMKELTVSDLTGRQYSKIAKALTSNTHLGSVTFAGEAEENDTFSDEVEHSEFYIDEDSLLSVLTEVFGLEYAKEAMTEEEITEDDDAYPDEADIDGVYYDDDEEDDEAVFEDDTEEETEEDTEDEEDETSREFEGW